MQLKPFANLLAAIVLSLLTIVSVLTLSGASIRYSIVTAPASGTYTTERTVTQVYDEVVKLLASNGSIDSSSRENHAVVSTDSQKNHKYTILVRKSDERQKTEIDVGVELIGDWQSVEMISPRDLMLAIVTSLGEAIGSELVPLKK